MAKFKAGDVIMAEPFNEGDIVVIKPFKELIKIHNEKHLTWYDTDAADWDDWKVYCGRTYRIIKVSPALDPELTNYTLDIENENCQWRCWEFMTLEEKLEML